MNFPDLQGDLLISAPKSPELLRLHGLMGRSSTLDGPDHRHSRRILIFRGDQTTEMGMIRLDISLLKMGRFQPAMLVYQFTRRQLETTYCLPIREKCVSAKKWPLWMNRIFLRPFEILSSSQWQPCNCILQFKEACKGAQ